MLCYVMLCYVINWNAADFARGLYMTRFNTVAIDFLHWWRILVYADFVKFLLWNVFLIDLILDSLFWTSDCFSWLVIIIGY